MKYSEAIAEILLSNGEEYEQARKVIAGNLDNLAEVFGPRIRELSQFRTQLDIAAGQQMQAAVMEQGQAGLRRASTNLAFANLCRKSLTGPAGGRRRSVAAPA